MPGCGSGAFRLSWPGEQDWLPACRGYSGIADSDASKLVCLIPPSPVNHSGKASKASIAGT
jgi:hypothetical protein